MNTSNVQLSMFDIEPKPLSIKVNVIDLWPIVEDCVICGTEYILKYYLPMYEGKIVKYTDSQEWAGMHVCKECYDKYSGDSHNGIGADC